MRLLSLRLQPFGRFTDRTVAFEAGLNVVLGPNEAGKSTLLRALRTVLFVPARLTAAKRKDLVGDFLPTGGGDHAAVEAALEAADGRYTLRRQWGGAPSAQLLLPSGAVLSEDDAIGEELRRILPAAEGSLRAVLLTGQAELAGTVDMLRKGEHGIAARDELSGLLRKALRETGGVSVDRFRRILEERIAEAAGRWDFAKEAPEGGRGTANRWTRGAGSILKAFYGMEEARAALEAANSFDSGLDEANRAIAEAARAAEAGRAFLAEHERTYRDARKRGELESDLRAALAEETLLQAEHTAWVLGRQKETELGPAIGELQARCAALQAEMKAAGEAEKARGLREKAARVEKLSLKEKAAREKLAAVRRLDRRQLDAVRKAAAEVEKRKAVLQSGRLSIRIKTRAALRLETRRDVEQPETLDLEAGETRTFEAGLSVGFRHPDFDFTATVRGREEQEGIKLKEEQARLAALLAACGCGDAEAAERACRAWEDASADAEKARRDLDEELEGEPEEAFRSRLAALGPAAAARSLAEVTREATQAESDLRQARRDLEAFQAKARELSGRYGDPASLLLKLAAAAGREKACRDALSSCAPLPEGFTDAAAFIEAYEKAQARARDAAASLSGLEARKEALLEHAPEASSEEAAEELETRRELFQAALARGKALLRVRDAAERLASGGDEAVFGGLRAETARLLSAVTGGRWEGLDLRDGLPEAARARDGTAMPRRLLSAGTADALALALRLAMAGGLLTGKDGFLVMDDPLVDLDPARQEAAAAEIRAFAGKHQTLILTCHPRHAEILGGTRIAL